ncbi:hypothetical protein [Aliarcobacter vitoriensis]|uniref:Uncharacterized protein n=1 Tax=Aliarcobacter vitoriensis TaxID=2011099 RepID=A0A366MT08_9BACT|nr:hypothetical protein [Aliarcobacter vitoriensis]RBQ28993.1 hypothetical protein CRU91_06375 [Aliarcobacter vitoriensis]RBQ31167.1 hypothetical protein CRU92_08325 [Arcobacter sp. FW59]
MQTLTLQIKDSFVKDFINIIEPYKDKIQIKQDENLDYDPYFYERQKELHNMRADIKNGTIKMSSHKDVWSNIKQHLQTLENK